ncbi:MAG: MtnX-like HAD-IB family phosphatase [candidate division KSB1 bacterium]|nr:MtnX-like HAD-IB family phosphatase [candidate division KSB1 bacterium]MDZ7293996.1 MtnX-like HAD-IB family phosphatase [candidate division KSB1 bacterium]MDZ7385381.1 MtnX-like HAD-IB family phosphatase [candidate division KSB1 bacterium]MDZ7392207.1 MtnX-like HAD-IB family phosphatase [candidate division KSB1 bacterium]
MKLRIFTDFDGTVAAKDVGDGLFARFAHPDWQKAVQAWKQGLITSRECLERECKLARATADSIAAYADEQQLDPYFSGFASFCAAHQVPLMVLSDGLDFYIERILRRHGLGHIPFRSNHLIFGDDGVIIPEFPYFELGCRVCGNCKGYHVRTHRADGEVVIYVGDGLSDRCGAEEADFVLAKGDLLRYCRTKHLPHAPFQTFADCLDQVKTLLTGRDPLR